MVNVRYSKVEDGAFCRFCALFGNKAGAGVGNQPVGALCVMKFSKWKNALERFADHESSKYHCDSVLSICRNYTPSPEQIINRLSETSNRRLNMCL